MESNAFFSVDFAKICMNAIERDIELYPNKTEQEQLNIINRCIIEGMTLKDEKEAPQKIADTMINVAILSRWNFKQSILLMAMMIAECPIPISEVMQALEVKDVTLQ